MDAEQAFISMYGQMSRRHRTIFKKELSIIRKAVSGSVTDSAALPKCKRCGKAVYPICKDCLYEDGLPVAGRALPSGANNSAMVPCDYHRRDGWSCRMHLTDKCGKVPCMLTIAQHQ